MIMYSIVYNLIFYVFKFISLTLNCSQNPLVEEFYTSGVVDQADTEVCCVHSGVRTCPQPPQNPTISVLDGGGKWKWKWSGTHQRQMMPIQMTTAKKWCVLV